MPDDQLDRLRLLLIHVHEVEKPGPIRRFLLQIATRFAHEIEQPKAGTVRRKHAA